MLKLQWWVKYLGPSVQFSRSVVSDSLRPHELQHNRPPCHQRYKKKKVLSVMKGVCTSCDKVWKQGPNPELTGGDGEGKGHFSLREPRSQLCGEGRKGKETEVTATVIAPKHRVVWCVYSTQKGIHGGREWLFSPSLAILLYSKGGSCWGSDDH